MTRNLSPLLFGVERQSTVSLVQCMCACACACVGCVSGSAIKKRCVHAHGCSGLEP